MKKNFFKKLSFVLALAMIISTLAPAASAFAATAPKLSAKSKTLLLGTDRDKYDFNISNKQKGWKYEWTSSNDDVASVATNGLTTANKIGTADIKVVITKGGEDVATLVAPVTVKDNIKDITAVTCSDAKQDVNKLAVAKDYTFARAFVTDGGSTTDTTAKTIWTVNSDKATVSATGVFNATEPGKYTITAMAFQSMDKYNTWKATSDAASDLLLASKTLDVTVVPGIVSVKQKDIDTFTINFDSPMTDVAKNLTVYQVLGSTNANAYIVVNGVEMSNGNKTADVTVFVPFTEKGTYLVKYTDMADNQFVAATTDAKDVKSMQVLTTSAEISTPTELKVALYNADNVNIADAELLTRVEWTTSNNATYYDGTNKMLTMFKVGDTTTVTAKFHTYEYDTNTGLETGVLSASGVVTCKEQSASSTGLLNAYTVVTAGPSFTDTKHTVAAGDTGLKLFVQLKGKQADGTTDKWTDNTTPGPWKYTSSNPATLIVNDTTGELYPAKEGTAVVVVEYNNAIVGACSIVVTGARKLSTFDLSAQAFTLSNDPQVQDVKTVSVTTKDQLGDTYNNVSVEVGCAASSGALATLLTSGVSGKPVSFNAAGISKGMYSFTVKITDTANSGVSITKVINVNVAEPSDIATPGATPYYYAIEADKTTYDTTIKSDDQSEIVTLSLFGYASNGVRTRREVVTGGTFTTTVTKDGSGVVATPALNGTDAEINLTPVDGGNFVQKLATGTYLVRATDASGKAINATYFTVTDNQAKPTVKVNKFYTTAVTEAAAVNDCFDFNLGGTDCQVQNGNVVYETAGVTGKQIFIKKVYIDETIGLVKIKHTVDVNMTISYKN